MLIPFNSLHLCGKSLGWIINKLYGLVVLLGIISLSKLMFVFNAFCKNKPLGSEVFGMCHNIKNIWSTSHGNGNHPITGQEHVYRISLTQGYHISTTNITLRLNKHAKTVGYNMYLDYL